MKTSPPGPRRSDQPTSVFISYSRKDVDFVRRLADDLQRRVATVRVFYDMLLAPGASWAATLSSEIESADFVVAVLSPDYLESPWAQQELAIALARRSTGESRLLPVLIRPCTPKGLVATLTWVDFTRDYEEALATLIWGITGERPRAAKGVEPGLTTSPLPPEVAEAIQRDVEVRVEQFKAKTASTALHASTADARTSRTSGRKRCFVAMPFGDADLEVVYDDFIKPTLTTACQLQCIRGDDAFGSNVVMDDIIKSIDDADVVLADLTRKNANVFYEVGIAHAREKRVLLLAQSIEDVPFDLRHRRVLLYDYSPRGCKRLESTLRDNMNAVMAGP